MIKRTSISPPSANVQAPKAAPTAAPTASSSQAPAPAQTSRAPSDGFTQTSAAGNTAPTRAAAPVPQRPGGPDVSADFTKNPSMFMANNTVNANNLSVPHGVATPTPQQTFVPANDARVTLQVNQHPGKNANISLEKPGQQGAPNQAYYLHYLSGGMAQNPQMGSLAGISGVPRHPKNTPTTIVTGQLNGCAVHAFHDKKTDTMSFVHHADYHEKFSDPDRRVMTQQKEGRVLDPNNPGRGPTQLQNFKNANPHLEHLGSVTPMNYSYPTTAKTSAGAPTIDSGATAVIQYNKPQNGGNGQWVMTSQLNAQQPGVTQEQRPVLVPPELKPSVGKQPNVNIHPLQEPTQP